jgi:hypothetical protein
VVKISDFSNIALGRTPLPTLPLKGGGAIFFGESATLVAVEIFSKENWWKRPGAEVIATCIERCRRVC